MTRLLSLAAALLPLLVAAPSPAAIHLSVIHEVLVSYGGDTTVQYVEIEMLAGGQVVATNSVLGTFDASGAFVDDFIVPGNLANSGAGVTWLMGTAGFETQSSLTPDFQIDISLPVGGGMVCWGSPGLVPPDPTTWDHTDPENYIDCLAYGTYSGPSNSFVGNPTSLDGAGQGMLRISETQDNATDFTCADPATPMNNSSASATLPATTPCPTPVCGDGVVEAPEECDDSNTVTGDGCDGACLLECGNGTLDPLEECDDTNRTGGDGCDESCILEICGNGVLQIAAGEECDDGNTIDGDGCERDCLLPNGFPLTKTEMGCVNEMNKRFAGVAKVGGKAATSCLKGLAKGKLTGDLPGCLAADASGKVTKSEAKTVSGEQKKCDAAELPVFGYTDAATANTAARQAVAVRVAEVFGGAPIADKKLDKEAAACQQEAVKALAKLGDTAAKAFNKGKKSGLKAGASSATELATLGGSALTSEKVAKVRSKAAKKLAKKCPAGDLSAWFEAGLDASSSAALADSVAASTLCRLCLALEAADAIDMDCDAVDDGATNTSCP